MHQEVEDYRGYLGNRRQKKTVSLDGLDYYLDEGETIQNQQYKEGYLFWLGNPKRLSGIGPMFGDIYEEVRSA